MKEKGKIEYESHTLKCSRVCDGSRLGTPRVASEASRYGLMEGVGLQVSSTQSEGT